MTRLVALSALLAWVMVQVPLVLCDSTCGQSQGALFLLDAHSCHDVESVVHRTCCGHHHGPAAPADPGKPAPRENDGEHVLVTIEGPAAPVAVALPVHAPSFLDAAHAPYGIGQVLRSAASGLTWAEVDPPPEADPVSASDRLLV
jgi:hypothetical protein